MKKITLMCITILYSITFYAQTTAIPDANFEQALIDLGLDSGAIDGSVPTANISSVTDLDVSEKNISDLTGIADFTSLESLNCVTNNLTSLDVSQNTALRDLRCSVNQIESLDVSQNTSLEFFICANNNLTSLDVTQNTALTSFSATGNQITELDLSNNINLIVSVCSANQLTYLNIKNGNNTNLNYFTANSNPNLTCIEVDDVAYSTDNWNYIDAQTSFSTDCANLSVEDESIALFSIYPNPANTTLFVKNNTNDAIIKTTLFNAIGQKVWSANGNTNTINVENFPKGIYMLTGQTNHKISSKQILLN